MVVGLSGGADSTLVLLAAARAVQINPAFSCLAVHCIHGLDADDPVWLTHCITLCNRVGVKLKTPKLNIVYGNGRSPEEISRSERYNALLRNITDGGVLLLGHQADDQVENFFLALKRGSGPYGLSGMRYMVKDERGTIIRPLLDLSKAQIIEVIEALGYSHVFDISNTYLKFERNFIRLKVLPLLKERFAAIDNAVLRSSMLCSYEHDLAERYTKEHFDRCYDKSSDSLNFSELDTDDLPLVSSIVRMFAMTKLTLPPELNAVNEIISLMKISPDQSGEVKLDGISVRRFRNRLFLVEDREDPKKALFTIKPMQQLCLGDYRYTLVTSDKTLLSQEFVLDFTYKGSQLLKPLCRNHRREIKKLFAEYEVPVWKRASVPLVLRASDGKALLFGNLCCLDKTDLELVIE